MQKSISNRYAKALFEVAKENRMTDRVKEDIVLFLNLDRENNLNKIFTNPRITYFEKEKLLDNVLSGKISKIAQNFLKILLRKKRMHLLPDIYNDYFLLVEEEKGEKVAEVKSKVPLSEEEERKLIVKLEEKFKKKIRLEKEIDEKILGGLIVKIEDKIIDGSVRGKLKKFKEQLIFQEGK